MDEDKVVTYKGPDYAEKYANNIAVVGRLLDFSLQFGMTVVSEDESTFHVEYHQGVLLSPQEAKFLAVMLNSELRRYEERFGLIPTVKPQTPVEVSEPAGVAANGEVIQ